MKTRIFVIAQKDNENRFFMGNGRKTNTPLILFTLPNSQEIFEFAESSLLCKPLEHLYLLTATIDFSSLPQSEPIHVSLISYIKNNMNRIDWNIVDMKLAEDIYSDSYRNRLMHSFEKECERIRIQKKQLSTSTCAA